MAGADDIPAFRSMRTLRALRPLRAVSRWEGMRVSTRETAHCHAVGVGIIAMLIDNIYFYPSMGNATCGFDCSMSGQRGFQLTALASLPRALGVVLFICGPRFCVIIITVPQIFPLFTN